MEISLEALKQIKYIFDIQSDFSTHCNGYAVLCSRIKLLEKEEWERAKEAADKKDCPDGQHEVKQGELKCANCGTPYLHGQK